MRRVFSWRRLLAACHRWFEEKKDWYAAKAPLIRTIRGSDMDTAAQDAEIAARGLALREWNGPALDGAPRACFDDGDIGPDWFRAQGWRLPDDFEAAGGGPA